MTCLLQYLNGESNRAIQCFSNEQTEYIMTLKNLKQMFLPETMNMPSMHPEDDKRKQITNGGCKSLLLKYYYTISDCIIALGQLSYIKDLHSSDILREVVQMLAPTFHGKFTEYCFKKKQTQEATLVDFGNWLQDQILVPKEAYLPPQKGNKKGRGTEESYIVATTMINTRCILDAFQNHYSFLNVTNINLWV